jgi:2-dehydropantoate 2-reductase
MWEKWMFLATLAGMTCLVHGSIGDIVAAGGKGLVELMLEECRSIGAANGFEQRPPAFSRAYALLTQSGSSLAASMMRDLERGGPIEADHIIGDLLRRQPAHGAEPLLLKAAYLRLMVYEGQRAMHAG